MKTLPALCSTTVALLMVSCASPIAKRIEHNPEIFNGLSARHKVMVQEGRIEEGMTKPAVFLAWGRPDHAQAGSKSGRKYERWSYAAYEAVPSWGWGTGVALGVGHWHGHGGYCGPFYDIPLLYEPAYAYVPYEAAHVEFLNGTVSAWSASK